MQRGSIVSLFSSALLALGLLTSAGSPANAQTCEEQCEAAKNQCLTDAREDQQACQADCRSNFTGADLGECMRGCATEARSTRDACRATFQACKAACEGATTTSTTSTSSTVTTTTSSSTSTTLPTSPSPAFVG